MIFKVICQKRSYGQKTSPILTRIVRFRTVTQFWLHWWIWNDAHSLRWYRRGALLFFEVIHQISGSHRLKNWWFESSLGKITRPVAAIKSVRVALFCSHRMLDPTEKKTQQLNVLQGRGCTFDFRASKIIAIYSRKAEVPGQTIEHRSMRYLAFCKLTYSYAKLKSYPLL